MRRVRDPNVARFHALAAYTFTVQHPWIPARVDADAVRRTLRPDMASRFAERLGEPGGSVDADVLDAIVGGLSGALLENAVSPSPRTRYAELFAAAARGSARALRSAGLDAAASLLEAASRFHGRGVAENLEEIYSALSSISPAEAERLRVELEGGDGPVDVERIVVLVFTTWNTRFSVDEAVEAFLQFVDKRVARNDVEIRIVAPSRVAAGKVETRIYRMWSRFVHDKTYTLRSEVVGMIRGREDAVRAAEAIAALAGGDTLYVFLFDAPDVLLDALSGRLRGRVAVVTQRTSREEKPETVLLGVV